MVEDEEEVIMEEGMGKAGEAPRDIAAITRRTGEGTDFGLWVQL